MNDRATRIANLSPEQRRVLELMLQERAQARTDERIPALPRRSESGQPALFPLSSTQRAMWFHEQPPSRVYNLAPQRLRLRGPLHVAALEASLHEICARHEALRTTFGTRDGEPVQIVGPPRPVALTRVDLRELPPEAREAEASRLLVREARRPFDLARDLMLRATLVRLHDEEHVLMLVMHHIVSDAWSMDVLLGELSALYNASRSGRRASLPELPVQYADYVVWQWRRLQDGELQRLMDYWKDQLADAPVALHMPAGRPRLWRLRTPMGRRQTLSMPAWLLQELHVLCCRQNVTLFMTLLAAWATLLHRYSGEEDILINTFSANRNRPEVEGVIGYFADSLILRHDLSGDPSFTELLGRVRKTATDAFSHSELPGEKLHKELYVDCQITFMLESTTRSSLKLDGLQVERIRTGGGRGTTPFLWLTMIEGVDGLTARLRYDGYLFEAATIQRMLGDFQTLLKGIVADPEQRIGGLPLLTEAEQPAAAEAQGGALSARGAQGRSWSIRFRKRFRRSQRHARRAAGRFLRVGQAWPLVGGLITRIKKILGRRLLPPVVTEPFWMPSAEQLGEDVRWGSGEAPRAPLVAIRRHGLRPPFFCVPGNGDVLSFHALAQRLGSDQPFYGFQPQDQPGERANLLEIADIAANYVREVRELQPEGPYFLGGHSYGGLVAFEMARQLRSQGWEVALLALFDTELNTNVPIQKRLRLEATRLQREGPLCYVRGVAKSILWTLVYRMWPRLGYSLPSHLSSTTFASTRAARSYKAQPYPGRLTLFRAMEPCKEDGRDPHLGWEGVAAGGVEVHEVPGDHFTLLEEPHVQILAAQLKGCLEHTQASSS